MSAAREFFEGVRAAALAARAAREALECGPARRGDGGRGPSDPVLARAMADEDARARLRDAESAVSEGRAVCAGLRAAYSRKADAVEGYYCDAMPWDEVAASLHVSRRAALMWRDELLDWCDLVGLRRAALGVGVAES